MRVRLTLLAPLWLLPLAAAIAAPPEAAMQVLAQYSAAFNRHDCEAMLSLTSPAIIKRLERMPNGRASYCDLAAAFARDGVRETLGPVTATRVDGSHRLLVVEHVREAGAQSALSGLKTTGSYLLHSSDGGDNWHVLDNGCLDVRWVKEVYPAYDGDPPLQPSRVMQSRGTRGR